MLTAAGALSADNYDKSIAAMNVLLGYTHIMKSVRRNPGVKSDEYSTWGTIYLDEAVVTAPTPNNDYYEDYPWYWNNYEYDYTWGNNNNDNNISGGGGGSYGSGGGGGGGGGGGNSQSPTASLWCTNFEISLGDSYNLSLLVYPFGMTQTVRYEILDNGTWYVLHDDYQSPLPLALKPGNFRLRADVHLSDGTHLVSNETSIKVQYPDVSAIKANAIVSSRMDAVWAETKNAASAAGRYEKGFWIYVDTRTGQLQYECESTITGDLITGCVGTHASIKPSTPRDDPARNPLTGGRYFIAFFHTHTPLTYCSEGSRQTGPSTSDISYHTGDSFSHIPGLLYDYVGATIVNYETGQSYIGIKAGHNINDAATIHTIGIDRRRTPPMQ